MAEQTPAKPILDTIPDPQTVRAKLTETLREATLLRKLLKLSEQKAKAKREVQVA